MKLIRVGLHTIFREPSCLKLNNVSSKFSDDESSEMSSA